MEVEQLSFFSLPAGHRYYHYTIGERLFSGVFVGRDRVRT